LNQSSTQPFLQLYSPVFQRKKNRLLKLKRNQSQ
jgi:hypothetical protein